MQKKKYHLYVYTASAPNAPDASATFNEPEPNVQYSPAPDIEIRSLSQEGNAIANSLIAKSIACVRFLDVASSTVDNTPSVVVAFLDQTNAVVIIERVAEVEIHFLDSVRHKDGTRANNLWGPLLEFIAGTHETHLTLPPPCFPTYEVRNRPAH